VYHNSPLQAEPNATRTPQQQPTALSKEYSETFSQNPFCFSILLQHLSILTYCCVFINSQYSISQEFQQAARRPLQSSFSSGSGIRLRPGAEDEKKGIADCADFTD